MEGPPTVLNHLRSGFGLLCRQVDVALLTHAGDPSLLRGHIVDVARYSHTAELHVQLWPEEELEIVRDSLSAMLFALETYSDFCEDEPDEFALHNSMVQLIYTGRPGRPKVGIHPGFLEDALTIRGPCKIASVLNCSSRTVRRRALELGLRDPCPAMFSLAEVDGQLQRILTTATPPMSTLTEEELDEELGSILQLFPFFGYRMLKGALLDRGHRVSCRRICASYARAWGPPSVFGNRPIVRNTYWVPGVNSLWHHDGNHDLIRWKIVTHSFIDGKSRFITGIRAHDNNRSETVLNLFLDATWSHGWPSRLRGDHGGENILCAEVMEAKRGYGRGSYIWGTSPHNSRIERSWLDYHRGIVVKWKPFFIDLEHNYGLNAENDAHIWLLHFLFLNALNRDIQDWHEAWNMHYINTPEPGHQSPREMFLFGMHWHGPRGIDVASEDSEHQVHIPTYGINWSDNAMAARALGREAREHRVDIQQHDPFIHPSIPAQLSMVVCDEPSGPLTRQQVDTLGQNLSQIVDVWSENMEVRKQMWIQALQIVHGFFAPTEPTT